MLEWFSLPHYDGVPLLEEILTLMRGHGYVLYNIYPSRKLKTGVLRYGEAKFISETFHKTRLSGKGAT